jgi:hypothetical protein
VTRRKRTKDRTKRISFKSGTAMGSKQSRTNEQLDFTTFLKAFVFGCAIAAIAVGLYFADKHIRYAKPAATGTLELVDVPEWIYPELRTKVLLAAGSQTFKLDENAAQKVAENLVSFAWLDNVVVQTTHDRILIKARWRKPLALIKTGLTKFYIDADKVVLDFMPLPTLSIVMIRGVMVSTMPPIGQVLERDDLDRMDQDLVPDKPLLREIESIDVSNFNGREDSRAPHIVLYAKDRTQIIWGAEIGAWSQYMEAKDEDKLAKLYSYYSEHGSLLGGAKYINLRDPQDKIPLPIDKY